MNLTKHITFLSSLALTVVIAGAASAASFIDTLERTDLDNLGYVDENTALEYDHVFLPGESVESIEAVYLAVVVTDDFYCVETSACQYESIFEPEAAVLSLDQVDWTDGQATFNVFWGEVTAQANLQAAGDALHVTITSSDGDFLVHRSTMIVQYTAGTGDVIGAGTSGPSTAVPEPSAAMVFLLGGLTLSTGLRRRR